jgi:hypothetical protein
VYGSGRGLILRYYLSNLPGITGENHETLSHDSWSSGRDLKLGPPELEVGVLATRPRRSICLHSMTITLSSKEIEKSPTGQKLLLDYNIQNKLSRGELRFFQSPSKSASLPVPLNFKSTLQSQATYMARAGPRHVGAPGRLIIWRPFKPTLFKYLLMKLILY